MFRTEVLLLFKVGQISLNIHSVVSVLRQVRMLFQSEFSTQYDLVLPFPIFSILSFTYGHPVAVYPFSFLFLSLANDMHL